MIWSSFGRKWAALPNAAASLTALGVSTFIKTLLDDADAATARTTLGAVGLTGNETVAGVKTFSSNPVLSGGGISFPATQSASADVNTLDDYEEGSFTPVITGGTSAGTGTYSLQQGLYTKVGNRVIINITVQWTAHTGTGSMLVTGLPFTAGSTAAVAISYSDLTYTSPPTAIVQGGTTQVAIFQAATNAARANIAIEAAALVQVGGAYAV